MSTSQTMLKSQTFRREREADWRRLEALLEKAEKRSVRQLSDREILAIPVLYRSTLSALSVARETSLDQALITYLETLSARAYFFVYGSRVSLQERLGSFFLRDWPDAVRSLWRQTLVSGLLMLLGAVLAYGLVQSDPEWFHVFVPPELAAGRDPGATTKMLEATLAGGAGPSGLSTFAAFLFTHNAQVGIMAFAFGFAFCLPTALLMMFNGAGLGAMAHLFIDRGLGLEFGGWLLIHGVTELFAVTLAGAAGLHIGWAVAFPGPRRRLDAALEAGRTAATVMGGVIVMLFFAGLLEGFGRQMIHSTPIRYAVALGTGLLWAVYYYGPRPGSRR